MTKRKLTLLGAAFAGAMLAASVGANDLNRGATHSGGVMTPSSPNETAAREMGRVGQPALVRDGTPTSPNESNPSVLREHQDPIARGDNPNLPNPVTPLSPNESGPSQFDPTNQPGIPRGPVGATR